MTKKKIKNRPKGFKNSTLDKAWAKKVKELAENCCEMCGETKNLSAHHIQPRRIYNLRWYLPNGICLCENCHTKENFSAHKNPLFFYNHVTLGRGEDWYWDIQAEMNIDWHDKLDKIKEALK